MLTAKVKPIGTMRIFQTRRCGPPGSERPRQYALTFDWVEVHRMIEYGIVEDTTMPNSIKHVNCHNFRCDGEFGQTVLSAGLDISEPSSNDESYCQMLWTGSFQAAAS